MKNKHTDKLIKQHNENMLRLAGYTGIKQSDLKKCCICNEGMMHKGNIHFYRLRLEQLVVNLNAVQKQHGLEMFFGQAAALASVMGTNEDMAQVMASTGEVLICAKCALEVPVAALITDKIGDYDEID